MIHAISTFVHVRERLHPGILERLAQGGATGIEIFAMRSHYDYTNAPQLRELASFFHSQPAVKLESLHAPPYAGGEWGRFDSAPLNIAGGERKDRVEAMDEIKRAIESAEILPFRYLNLHIGLAGDFFEEQKFEHALSSVEHLRAFARPLGVRLLLENIPGELATPVRLAELIRALHYDDIGICLDLGHAHMESGIGQAFESVSPLLRSVHVHDNHGEKDEHLWPGAGTIDWKKTMELLRTAPQPPNLVLEVEGDHAGNPDFGPRVPEKMHEAWTLLES